MAQRRQGLRGGRFGRRWRLCFCWALLAALSSDVAGAPLVATRGREATYSSAARRRDRPPARRACDPGPSAES
jgi:hypothetical protein